MEVEFARLGRTSSMGSRLGRVRQEEWARNPVRESMASARRRVELAHRGILRGGTRPLLTGRKEL